MFNSLTAIFTENIYNGIHGSGTASGIFPIIDNIYLFVEVYSETVFNCNFRITFEISHKSKHRSTFVNSETDADDSILPVNNPSTNTSYHSINERKLGLHRRNKNNGWSSLKSEHFPFFPVIYTVYSLYFSHGLHAQ